MARYTAGESFGDIYVNGEPQNWILEADDEHGFAIQFIREGDGFKRDGDRLATRVIVGKVQFVPRGRQEEA